MPISAPSHCTANSRHERTGSPSSTTVHAPHMPCSQPRRVPGQPAVLAKRVGECLPRLDGELESPAVDRQRNVPLSCGCPTQHLGGLLDLRGGSSTSTNPRRYSRRAMDVGHRSAATAAALAASATCSEPSRRVDQSRLGFDRDGPDLFPYRRHRGTRCVTFHLRPRSPPPRKQTQSRSRAGSTRQSRRRAPGPSNGSRTSSTSSSGLEHSLKRRTCLKKSADGTASRSAFGRSLAHRQTDAHERSQSRCARPSIDAQQTPLRRGVGVRDAAAERALGPGSADARCAARRSPAGRPSGSGDTPSSSRRCVTRAPIANSPLTSSTLSSPLDTRPMSTTNSGRSNRSAIRGTNVCPPARTFASEPCSARIASTSSIVSGAA